MAVRFAIDGFGRNRPRAVVEPACNAVGVAVARARAV